MLIDDVAPHGGATLALAGAHRVSGLAAQSQALRAQLKTSKDLPTDLKALGINATKHIRMMATSRFILKPGSALLA